MTNRYLANLSQRPAVVTEERVEMPAVPLEEVDRTRSQPNRRPKPFDISDESANYVIHSVASAVSSVCLNSGRDEVNSELNLLDENGMGGAPSAEYVLCKFREPYMHKSFESLDDVVENL